MSLVKWVSMSTPGRYGRLLCRKKGVFVLSGGGVPPPTVPGSSPSVGVGGFGGFSGGSGTQLIPFEQLSRQFINSTIHADLQSIMTLVE